jgi:hypothetical protein
MPHQQSLRLKTDFLAGLITQGQLHLPTAITFATAHAVLA